MCNKVFQKLHHFVFWSWSPFFWFYTKVYLFLIFKMISDNLLAFTILFEALAQTSDIYYGYLMCSTRSDTNEHDREKEESENEHELEDWAEWQDEFLDKPPYLKNFLGK